MEIKLKKIFPLVKWIDILLTISLVVIGLIYKAVPCYILAAVCGLMSLAEIIRGAKNRPVVMDENGIRIGRDYRHLWNQVEHCCFDIRKSGFGRLARNRFGIMVATEKDQERHFINLSDFSFSPEKLAKEVNDILGKEIFHL